MDGTLRQQAVALAADTLADDSPAVIAVLGDLWDEAFEAGRLAALDEFQDRFCVCMKT